MEEIPGKPHDFKNFLPLNLKVTIVFKGLIKILIVFCASYSFATTDTVRTIDALGVQGGNAYFSVKEGFSAGCQYGFIYLDITTDFGKAAYSTLLSAKSSGRKLSRIDYSQPSSTTCYLSLIQISD